MNYRNVPCINNGIEHEIYVEPQRDLSYKKLPRLDPRKLRIPLKAIKSILELAAPCDCNRDVCGDF